MAALAKSIAQVTGVDVDAQILKTVVMFSAAGLYVCLLRIGSQSGVFLN